MPVEKAVREALDDYENAAMEQGSASEHTHRLAGLFFRKAPYREPSAEGAVDPATIHITAMGPLGHVYLPANTHWDHGQKAQAARRIMAQAHIPLVLYTLNQRVMAVTAEGAYELPGHKTEILGADHPFADQVAADLIDLCNHPNAGDLVISGWRRGAPPLTFAVENGAHGGPGPEETRGFIMTPPGNGDGDDFLRAMDLRRMVQERTSTQGSGR